MRSCFVLAARGAEVIRTSPTSAPSISRAEVARLYHTDAEEQLHRIQQVQALLALRATRIEVH